MKRSVLIFLIFFCSGNLFSQWQQQVSNTGNSLNSVHFINSNTGWACGFETVLKTTDCGNTWNSAYLSGYHKSIFFTDENNGWICGENGKIFKTTNGGINWILMNSGVNSRLNQIAFSDQYTGLIAGSNNKILKTTDAGNSWNNVNIFNSLIEIDFYSVKILNATNYIVTGTESTVYTTTNSGLTWDSVSFGMPNPLLTVEFINMNTGWVSGCCGMFMKTSDGGKIWSPEVYLTPGYSVNSMKFIN
ncbi:MAG TPA: YCF48-related protein, partial [Ignavibacteria bacterium]|nr:YCF48-related protein [Ignavibacteria bacterium]